MNVEMPYDKEAEVFLLCRMMQSTNGLNEAMSFVNAEDFFDSKLQSFFRALEICYKTNSPIDTTNVYLNWKELEPEASLKDVINIFMANFSHSESISDLIERVKDKSRLRKLILTGRQLVIDASHVKSPSEVFSSHSRALEMIFSDAVDSFHVTEDFLTSDYLGSGLNILDYIQQKTIDRQRGISSLQGIPTGYNLMDSMLSGLCKGHFVIIGARPGVGKSTFMINMAHQVLKKGVKVGFFSLEMTAAEVAIKICCIRSDVNSQHLMQGKVSQEEFQRFEFMANDYKNFKLYIDDESSLRISRLIARAKRMIASQGIEIIFIDYLGEVKGEGKFANKQEEIQQVSKALRELAKTSKIPIVCACQLNRETEKVDRKPRKSDLRESGQIEADAHSILLLHSPEQADSMDQPGKLQVLIVKNRFGSCGDLDFAFKKDTGLISEIDSRLERRNLVQDIQEINARW